MQIASRQPLWRMPDRLSTELVLRASSASMTAKIAGGNLAAGHESVTVDWGDGHVDEYAAFRYVTHTYRRAKDYTVRISNDLSSFGYTSSSYQGVEQRDMMVELKNLGALVTSIEGYAFNNCHKMRGVIEMPNVTTINGYAFGTTLGITDFILPSMTRIVQESFYYGPSPTQIHIDNAQQIGSRFWDYYGGHLADMYIRSKTCQAIKAMSGFPFKAGASVRFHGSDGIVLGNGTIIHE